MWSRLETHPISIKRVYVKPVHEDGMRILVDRLWPRGLSKEAAAIDHWYAEVAPSAELRKWFGHRPERFAEFAARYRTELATDPPHLQHLGNLGEFARQSRVTLVYAAKDEIHNHAVVLLAVLRKLLN